MRQIKPGDFVEPCVLESVQGDAVPIPPPAQKILHLQFRRFAGCPICNLHLQSFIRRHLELVENQIQEVAVFHSSKSAMLEHQLNAPVMLFISTLPSVASAGQSNDKDGTQGTVSEPDCDDASATEYL